MISKDFNSIIELISTFTDDQTCIDHLEQLRWNSNVVSPFDATSKVYICKGNKYKCKNTGKYFNVKTGTLFDNTKVPLQKWFLAIWLITSHKKGISSLQLHRDIKVTQKTAWFMLHRIRNCFGINDEKLDNIAEVDETYVGGKNKNRHNSKKVQGTQGRSTKDKAAVLGMIEREGKVKAVKVPDVGAETLTTEILDNVKDGAKVYSDEWVGYKGLNAIYEHSFVNHSAKEYVNGDVHTNTIEGFWSLLKRGIIGIYHQTSKKHLQKYLDTFAFRYITRQTTEAERMNLLFANTEHRLKYKDLVK